VSFADAIGLFVENVVEISLERTYFQNLDTVAGSTAVNPKMRKLAETTDLQDVGWTATKSPKWGLQRRREMTQREGLGG
jgi:hypothetical protein